MPKLRGTWSTIRLRRNATRKLTLKSREFVTWALLNSRSSKRGEKTRFATKRCSRVSLKRRRRPGRMTDHSSMLMRGTSVRSGRTRAWWVIQRWGETVVQPLEARSDWRKLTQQISTVSSVQPPEHAPSAESCILPSVLKEHALLKMTTGTIRTLKTWDPCVNTWTLKSNEGQWNK